MSSNVNILLVDDETRNLDALESFLQSPDYRLVRVVTAEQALLLLLDRDFAAIVLDIQMPGMSGIELANLIKQRKRTQHIPIIFLTAYYQEDRHVMEGYGSGAVDYLTKPVNPQILKSKISVFVDLYRKTNALALTNNALEIEVTHRQRAEEALRRANHELEARVEARTADLIRVNDELREREAALRVSEAQAKAASRAKDDFLAALSHELRTPLNPVLLLATEGAGNPRLPTEARLDFETIARNVRLEARLIDDLLDLTAITRGKLTLKSRVFDLHLILEDAIALLRADLEEKRLTLELRIAADRHLVLGDDVRLKQVLWNVVKNAAKFTPDGGRIVVATESPDAGAEVIVSIRDTGIGMTADELGRIFNAFTQGDHASGQGAHQFGGLGLGLAISRMMVELHAGSITATSEGRNQGTTFVIRLPVQSADQESSDESNPPFALAPAAIVPGAGRSRRILLVEDHKSTAQALAKLLTMRQYDVVTADSMTAARALAIAGTYDLLISDIGLPDGSGYELMAELRARHGLIGIALTGYGMAEDVSRSLAAGFVTHLTKPVSVQALDSALLALSPKNSRVV